MCMGKPIAQKVQQISYQSFGLEVTTIHPSPLLHTESIIHDHCRDVQFEWGLTVIQLMDHSMVT